MNPENKFAPRFWISGWNPAEYPLENDTVITVFATINARQRPREFQVLSIKEHEFLMKKREKEFRDETEAYIKKYFYDENQVYAEARKMLVKLAKIETDRQSKNTAEAREKKCPP